MIVSCLKRAVVGRALGRTLATTDYGTFYHKDLTITKAATLKEVPTKDFGFGRYITDHMLEVDWSAKAGWGKPQIVPIHDFHMHPFNGTFQTCSAGFEGMKAYRDTEGRIRTFRPELNAERMVRTSLELCHPSFEPAELVKCIDTWLKLEERWVPPRPATLYIRPTLCSLSPTIGIEPPTATKVFIVGTPSGPYFPPHMKTVKLRVETVGTRAANGGTGHIKAAANYCVGIKYVTAAGQAGFQQVIWLNGKNITEAGASNVYFYIINKHGKKELVTPALDGTILPGVTRRSVLDLAKNDTRFTVAERPFPLAELVKVHKDKKLLEAFLCGTAAVIAPISSILYKDLEIVPQKAEGDLTMELYKKLTDIQYGVIEHPFSHLVH